MTELDLNSKDMFGWTMLHKACFTGDVSMASRLLDQPEINVNEVDIGGNNPFSQACSHGTYSVVALLLRDGRSDINLANNWGQTPLWWAAYKGRLAVVKLLLASGLRVDFSKAGELWHNMYTRQVTPLEAAKRDSHYGVVDLLERYSLNAEGTRHALRRELGLVDELAAELFARVVFLCEGLFQVKTSEGDERPARFFSIAERLPMELQMMLCYRAQGSSKQRVSLAQSELAFRNLAQSL
jgi:ankyrin repeat protein